MTPVVACAIAVVVLLVAIRREASAVVALSKLTASACFVWAAVAWGGLESGYGWILLVGLSLCALGDALLLPPGDSRWFRLGIGAFFLGHLVFAIAFLQLPQDGAAAVATIAALVPAAGAVLAWLRHRVPGPLRVPVAAYVAVISLMVATAIGAAWEGGLPTLALGALAFAVSDLAVARDRFVAPGFANSAWGLPLYFGAQLLLASTAALVR